METANVNGFFINDSSGWQKSVSRQIHLQDLRFMVSIGIITHSMSIRQNGTGKYTVHPRVQVCCEQTSSIPRHGRVGRGRE